jgi:hypothetical protein
MTGHGPLISDSEFEFELAVWRRRCRETKRGEPLPRMPRRVKWDRRTIIPDGLLLGRPGGVGPVRPIRKGSDVRPDGRHLPGYG